MAEDRLMEMLRAAESSTVHSPYAAGDALLQRLRAAEADPLHARPVNPTAVVKTSNFGPPPIHNPMAQSTGGWYDQILGSLGLESTGAGTDVIGYFTGLNKEQANILGEDAPSFMTDVAEVTGQVDDMVGKRAAAAEAQDAATDAAVAAQQSQKKVQQSMLGADIASQMAKSGASEEDMGVLKQFQDKFDVATLGMALLASNDGSGNLASNLGNALMMARQQKVSDNAAAAAAAAAGRKEAREERDLRRKEADTASTIANRGIEGEGLVTDLQSFISVSDRKGLPERTTDQENLATMAAPYYKAIIANHRKRGTLPTDPAQIAAMKQQAVDMAMGTHGLVYDEGAGLFNLADGYTATP